MHSIETQPVPALPPLRARWKSVLAYPAQLGALSTCVALALAHLIAQAPLGFIIDLVVWAAFFKYAFEVLRWSANGRAEAPEISFTVSDGVARYAMMLLVLSEAAMILLAYFYGAGAAFALGALLTFALPGILIVLALEEGMARALNPVVWLMLMQRLGAAYFLLIGAFLAALALQSAIAYLLHGLPWLIALPLTYFAVNYLMIANFHLIGSVIHEHADELGYGGHAELSGDATPDDPAERIVAAARERAASGDVAGAAMLLRDELRVLPRSLPLHQEYDHWLRQSGDAVERGVHAKAWIALLLQNNDVRRALDVLREARLADAAFVLDEPNEITRLAAAAAAAGQTQTALALLQGFHKRFRDHADVGRNYLLAAQLLAERMNREMPARALLQQIKLTLPNDPILPQVDAYIAYLDKLAATPARSS